MACEMREIITKGRKINKRKPPHKTKTGCDESRYYSGIVENYLKYHTQTMYHIPGNQIASPTMSFD